MMKNIYSRMSSAVPFAIRITIIYILLGALWILFSDRLMFLFFSDTQTLNQVSMYKGWFYVLLTGWLLYLLIMREMKKRNAIENQLVLARNKAQESEKLKSAFLNNISHEIRTPLNAILGFSELIVNPDLTDEQKASFSSFIRRGTTDLVDTIEDILVVSRIQVGQVQVENQAGDIRAMLEELTQYFAAHIKNLKGKENIRLGFKNYLKDDEVIVSTDFRHLKQVVNKLISNAVKFTSEGTIELELKKHYSKELIVSVKDTGCGIPLDKREVVFSPFRQADENSLNRKTGGSGLGLSIAKGLVELMQGRIWFESEEGKGSTFYFTVPI